MAAKPRVFIGSSSDHRTLAEELRNRLAGKATAVGWWDSPEFVNGYATLDALLKATETYDFAVFLLTADDEIASRAGSGPVPRDNVIFEYGLFLGRLRQGRVLAFAQRDARLPSDVAGIQMEKFDAPRDAHERVSTASVLAGIVGAAIDRTPDWWDLHLGDVVRGWSMDPEKAAFSVRLSRRSLDVRVSKVAQTEPAAGSRDAETVPGSFWRGES